MLCYPSPVPLATFMDIMITDNKRSNSLQTACPVLECALIWKLLVVRQEEIRPASRGTLIFLDTL